MEKPIILKKGIGNRSMQSENKRCPIDKDQRPVEETEQGKQNVIIMQKNYREG